MQIFGWFTMVSTGEVILLGVFVWMCEHVLGVYNSCSSAEVEDSEGSSCIQKCDILQLTFPETSSEFAGYGEVLANIDFE